MAEEWMTDEKEIEFIKEIERDSKWLYENYDKYREVYEDKLIAVKNEKILSVGDDMEELSKKIEEMGEDPRWIYVTSIPPKDLVFIL